MLAEAERLAGLPAGSRVDLSSLPLLEAIVRYLAMQVAAPEPAGADLMAIAERLQAEVQASSTRDVAILSGPLDDPAERAMLAWATVTGAALALEPNPAHRVATAAWVRPTVFHGTPEEIAGLRQWVEKERKGLWRRGLRPPLRRLRTVLVTQELSSGEVGFWIERGVRVARLPWI